jgi:hypothetical protein
LPTAISFFGKPYEEGKLISYAYDYEQATKLRAPSPLVPSLPGERIEYETVPEPGMAITLGVFGLSALSLKRKKARSPA